jgi:hypothetical protein
MLVKWNGDGLKMIPIIPSQVKSDEGRPLPVLSNIKLLPGVNQIDDRNWESAKDHVKLDLELGRLVEIKEKGKEEGGKTITVTLFKDLPAPKARAIIKTVTNVANLQDWLENEDRPDIRAALQNRLDFILKGQPQEIKEER